MRRLIPLALLLLIPGGLAAAPPEARFTGPWNVEALKKAPTPTWGETKGLVREVYYPGEPLDGKPTRVFGYYARPKTGDGPFPAVVLVHGGGGKAFAEWATLWAERGYVALAMDLAGHGPDGKRLADGGPEQDDTTKFRDFTPETADQMWTYHAVADVLRGHSLLAAQPEVDPSRIGVTGISWGGYLTCIVAGIDDRVKVAVPVYGCGFLQDDSAWIPIFQKMTPERRDRWVSFFDPSRYLPDVSCPILFVNGTNDFAYPLDSYRKSYRLVTKAPRTLCITVNMPHGHSEGWRPAEIGRFVDSVLTGGPPLPELGQPEIKDGQIAVNVTSKIPLKSARLHFTNDSDSWQKRRWTTVDATVGDGNVTAPYPQSAPAAAFLSVTDAEGSIVSTEHVEP